MMCRGNQRTAPATSYLTSHKVYKELRNDLKVKVWITFVRVESFLRLHAQMFVRQLSDLTDASNTAPKTLCSARRIVIMALIGEQRDRIPNRRLVRKVKAKLPRD